MNTVKPGSLLASHAWLPDGWRRNVLFAWDAQGMFTRIEPDSEDLTAPRLEGIALPGLVNLHSHAFQRAMAGLTEYRARSADSFWSWRERMYAFAARLGPETLSAIARQLYIEMLQAGYTSVCEFHYVHHDADGKAYAPASLLSACLVEAAADVGIGMTLLPVLYQASGFGGRAPLPEQVRFISTPEGILTMLDELRSAYAEHAGLRYGVAPHSLRAVPADSLRRLLDGLAAGAPVHIHIAEQQKEVDDCLATLGRRPVEWLLDEMPVDARWCLVHATHMTPAETHALARSGAVAGICPGTEANLGDGLFNAADYLAAGGRWGIGSDSHVMVCPFEELRLFEYGQRLLRQARNVLAPLEGGSVAAHLLRGALMGGAAASGRPMQGLTIGERADLLLFDGEHPDLAGKHGDQWLDSLVFGRHGASPLQHVLAGGRMVVEHGRHAAQDHAAAAYRDAMRSLLS